jgi:molybdopterin/thiamine biosynthesis adenylyltransferase
VDPGSVRFLRQRTLAGFGTAAQERLAAAHAVVIGAGGLGAAVLPALAGAGIGRITVVDDDRVEESNLHRQTLFDEEDVARGMPKAVAAAEKLRVVNGEVTIEPIATQLDAGNIEAHAAGVGVLLDGTDNFDTRFVMNDFAHARKVPWIYAACVGAYGLTMNILPGATPCLRCIVRTVPAPGTVETCDTAGVIAPIAALVGAVEAAEAIKILSGAEAQASLDLFALDLWSNTSQRFRMTREEVSAGCPTCEGGRYEHLDRSRGARSNSLCGRSAVQIHPGPGVAADLTSLAERLRRLGPVTQNPYLVRFEAEGCAVAVFADGRAIVSGTQDEAKARALYDRYVGA